MLILQVYQVFVDERSLAYAEDWKLRRGDISSHYTQIRIDKAKEVLRSILLNLQGHSDSSDIPLNAVSSDDTMNKPDAEFSAITLEDELSDIPAEMRDIVSAEIASFRERSYRKFIKSSKSAGPRGHMQNPAVDVSSDANNIHADCTKLSVNRVNNYYSQQVETVARVSSTFIVGSKVEQQLSSNDSTEIDNNAVTQDISVRDFSDYEKCWSKREKSRAAAIEREKHRDDLERTKRIKDRTEMRKKLIPSKKAYDEDNGFDTHHSNRINWSRWRSNYKVHEAIRDSNDRDRHRREQDFNPLDPQPGFDQPNKIHRKDNERDMDNRITQNVSSEMTKFKMNFGTVANKLPMTTAKKSVAEIESLLEDDTTTDNTRRKLRPINPVQLSVVEPSEEQHAEEMRHLIDEIPIHRDDIWDWKVAWDFLDESIIIYKIRPFIEKNILDYLGVQEQFLVNVIEKHIRKRSSAKDLLKLLEEVCVLSISSFTSKTETRSQALDTEAEQLLLKLWRMIILYTESERRFSSR